MTAFAFHTTPHIVLRPGSAGEPAAVGGQKPGKAAHAAYPAAW